MRLPASCFRLAIPFAVVLTAILLPLLGDEPRQGRKYALLVGVNAYNKDQFRQLQFPDRDVEELAKIFEEAGYLKDNIVLMTGQRGGKEAGRMPIGQMIRKQLNLLLQGCKEEDSIIIALAGHGVQSKGSDENFFCPADANLEDKQTLVSMKDLYAMAS